MSPLVKALLAVALIVPLVAYVAGSLAASGSGTPDRQGPVIINDIDPAGDNAPGNKIEDSQPEQTKPEPSPPQQEQPQQDDDEVRVVTPTPKPIGDDDDDERDERDDASDDSRDDTDDGDDTDD